MKPLFFYLMTALFSQTCFAQSESTPSISDLIPLRSCAQSVSTLIEGRTIYADWASENENSFYFLNCNDDYEKGQDHYVYTPTGVYHFFIKNHKDYKGGFEGTQFRLTLEGNTYYFKSNIVGGMGTLFDHEGKNLNTNPINDEDLKMDVSAKNPVLNYYMKTLTGKSDPKSAILALPVSGERSLKAQSCIQNQVIEMSSNLVDVYLHRKKYKQVSTEILSSYQSFADERLSHPACGMDKKVAETIDTLLVELRK